MPLREPTDASHAFLEQLHRLRQNIEQLGEQFQPQLEAFAGEIEQHHVSMQNACNKMHDLVDDMRLREASVRFNIWVMKAR